MDSGPLMMIRFLALLIFVINATQGQLETTNFTSAEGCPSPPNATNANFTLTGYSDGSIANVTCHTGFETNGGSHMICQNGSWVPENGEEISCTPEDCRSPPNVTNANFTLTGYSEGAVANYTCHAGFEANGGSHLICQNGSWAIADGEVINCTRITCGVPPYVPNGYRSYRYRYSRYRYPSSRYSSSRYGGRGYGYSSWSYPYYSRPTTYEIGEVSNYYCRSGYLLNGTSNSISCLPNGTWSTPLPQCQIRDCGPPPIAEGANRSYTSTIYRSRVTYTCQEGHYFSAYSSVAPRRSGYIVCSYSGTWSRAPACLPRNCGTPSNILNGVVFTRGNHLYGQSVTYECHFSYTMYGNATVTCQASGQWSLYPECHKVQCPSTPIIANGTEEEFKVFGAKADFGQSISYTCDRGFHIAGPPTAHCQIDGTWTQIPTCRLVDCHIPPAIHFGVHTWTTTTYKSVVDYSCDDGYKLIGVPDILCQSDGRWTDAPACELPPGQPSVLRHSHQIEGSAALDDLGKASIVLGVIALLSIIALCWKLVSPNGLPSCRSLNSLHQPSYKKKGDIIDISI